MNRKVLPIMKQILRLIRCHPLLAALIVASDVTATHYVWGRLNGPNAPLLLACLAACLGSTLGLAFFLGRQR